MYQASCISDFWYWYTQNISVILILILYQKCIMILDTRYFFSIMISIMIHVSLILPNTGPDDAKILAWRPNDSTNHVSLVFCVVPEAKVSFLSSKSRSGINNLCFCLMLKRMVPSISAQISKVNLFLVNRSKDSVNVLRPIHQTQNRSFWRRSSQPSTKNENTTKYDMVD